MQIFVRVKALGKRKDVLTPIPREIPPVGSLRELITVLVRQEVENFNSRGTEIQLTPWLSPEQIDAGVSAGKVGFGRLWSDRKADPEKAVTNAMQCFEDGLIRVFMGDTELTEPDAPLSVPKTAEIMSKIILLAEDSKIKDPSILSQIK